MFQKQYSIQAFKGWSWKQILPQSQLASKTTQLNMFYEYFYAKAVELEKMQMDFYIRTGIAWNDNLSEEIDNEGSAGEEQLQNIH